jgi:CubicO group peptidase (beta-lactamase class C family)
LEAIGFSGTVMIVDDGNPILNQGYGVANVTTNAPNTPDTIFATGSLTKLFTATSILQLHEVNLLNAEDFISTYLPDIPADKTGITITQLLQHTSGLAPYHDTAGDFQVMTREEAYDTILNAPLIAIPGSEYNYSNSGYTLLAILIEVVSGQTYQDYIRDHIFTPLNMTRTGFHGETFDNMAYTRNTFDGYGAPSDWDYSWVLVGNGGIVSTNADLFRFMTTLVHYELVSQETLSLWIDLGQINDWINVAGGGDALDYNASIYFHPVDDIFILSMTNTAAFPAEFVNPRLRQIIEGEAIPFPPEISTTPALEACYEGLYQLDRNEIFTVEGDEDGLIISASGQEAIFLLTGVSSPQIQEWYTRLTADTDALFEKLSHKDFSGLAELLDTSTEDVAQVWSQLENDNGVLSSYSVIGTSISQFGEQEAVTVVRLDFTESDRYILLSWDTEDNLVDFEIREAEETVQRRLYPIADNIFTTFSLFSDTNINIRFQDENNLLQIFRGEETLEVQRIASACP